MSGLTLPAGWIHCEDGHGSYLRRIIARTACIDVDPDAVHVSTYTDKITEQASVHELGRALIEAADLRDQLSKAATA